ncbi:MAG TPA: ABC transporter permease [Flavisolibacter sp.]|nr:ABC transporter permease [Flavisolibacter sp.]
MSLSRSFHSESVKLKRSASLRLCFIAAAILPFLMTMGSIFGDAEPKSIPLNNLFLKSGDVLRMAFLPMYIVLTSTMLLQIEYRDKAWKQVLSSPQRLSHIFFAKFIMLQLLIIGFITVHNLLLILSGAIINAVRPGYFNGGLDIADVLIYYANTYLVVLGISAIQFWLSLRFRNFIVPLAIGFCCWVIGLILVINFKLAFTDYYPYAFTALSVLTEGSPTISFLLWMSVANTLLFLAIGLTEFSIRKIKT